MNLLIVDDELFAIQGILKDIDRDRLKFDEILTANSCSQAMNIFLKEKVDILLCDIEMPFGNGLDLVEWVKKEYPKTECIFLTCHDEFSFARQAVSLQCLDYVLKPATTETINQVLEKAIGVITEKQKDQVYRSYGKMYIENMAEQTEEDIGDSKHAVEKTEEYIRRHINEDLSVEELAEKVYISSAHLSRLFKKKHGMTLIDYITRERMLLAKELLADTDMSVTMISAKTGYANYSYFTKLFKKTFGKTPRDYRTSLKK